MSSNSGVMTKHLIVDVKTGFSYGMTLDSEGICKTVQPFNTAIEKMDGQALNKFGPLFVPSVNPMEPEVLPFGKTIHAVEWGQGDKKSEVFTLVWPTKEDFEKGERPAVTKKELTDDLVKAGVAAAPRGTKGQKGSGVDNVEDLDEALKNIETMIGLDGAKRDIRQNIALAQFDRMKQDLGISSEPISRHMVFTGNPGTGKTTFAREVAKVYHALGFIEKPDVYEVKANDLIGAVVGETVKKTAEAIKKAKGGILFIDEAYGLAQYTASGSNGSGTDFGAQAITELVAAMENMREDLTVIVAGYPEPMKRFIDANEGLKSRFVTYISFEDFSAPQLSQILDGMMKKRGYSMDAEAQEYAMKLLENEKVRAQKDFGNARTVRNLVEKAEKELALRLQGENKLTKNHGLSDAGIKAALTTITLQDVKALSLDGLNAKTETSQVVFGGKEPVKPANDVKPEAPAVSKLKQSTAIRFGR